jgi:DNA repair exonuclease SbcCD nuclease subunit
MSVLRFVTFTDVHISTINPSLRIGSYEQDMIEKLEQIRLLGNKVKANFFLFGGDLFNLKAPMRNPHALNSKLIDLFKTYPAPIYATEGNHDLRNDSYDTFNEQPLNVLYSSDALIQARNIKAISNDISYRIRSIPFTEKPELKDLDKATNDVDINIRLLHLYSSFDGGMLFKNKIFSYDEISQLGDNIFLLGHYHSDQGIKIINKNKKPQVFINVGAVSRGSISEEDINRQPKVAFVTVMKDNDGKISYESSSVRLKVKPAVKVFDIEKHEKVKEEKKETIEFVSKLKEEMSGIPKQDKISEEIKVMNLEKKVLDKVNYFLEEADIHRKSVEL